jgi:hypothetical protein
MVEISIDLIWFAKIAGIFGAGFIAGAVAALVAAFK